MAARENDDWKEVAKNNGINQKTARGIIRSGSGPPKPRGGFRHRKLLAEHEDYLLQKLSENPGATLKSLKEDLLNKFHLTVGTSTIDRHLDSKLITVKKAIYQPETMNSA